MCERRPIGGGDIADGRDVCRILGGTGDPCCTPTDREQIKARWGRECPRVELTMLNESAVEIAAEITSDLAQSAHLGSWLWEWHTRDLSERHRRRMFERVRLYIDTYRSAAKQVRRK